MILSKSLNAVQMAKVAGCSDRSVRTICSNLRYFGSTKAPSNGVGWPRSVTSPMLDALCEHLLEKPNLYQDEMAIYLWDEFEVLVTTFSIGRALASIGWTKKAARRVAKGWNANLRDFYLLTCLLSVHITSYMWMSLAATSGLDLGGQVGLPLV